jgi:tetratricopeptide (TPR) repeat protein
MNHPPLATGGDGRRPARTLGTMIRSIAWAAVGGVLVAAAGFWVAFESPLQRPIAAWLRGAERTADAKPEDWPICTTMTAMGSEADWAQLDPDFAGGKRALVAENWNGAIAALKLAALRDPRNADIENYIGYAYRRLRQFGPAMQHYQQALVINRRHRSAHEHLGELFLVLREPAMAEQQLATLEEICLIPCTETEDLKSALAVYRTLATR